MPLTDAETRMLEQLRTRRAARCDANGNARLGYRQNVGFLDNEIARLEQRDKPLDVAPGPA
jgi:hypothetical protein